LPSLPEPNTHAGPPSGILNRVDLSHRDPGDIDPQIAAWLNAAPPVDVDFSDIAAIRAMSDAYMRETGGPAPRFSHPRAHLQAGRFAGVDTLVWTPTHEASRGIVIAAHGGGFMVGSALGAERIAVPLAAEHAITTISVEYRLAPEHRAPAALNDVCAVATAQDTSLPIAVHGSSAGATLAAGAALWARDHGLHLVGQSLSCPALDDRVIDDVWSPTWTAHATEWMWRHYFGDDPPPPYCAPGRHEDLRGLPPAHIVIATHDTLRSQGLDYARRLHDHGVAVHVHDVPGTVHGFDGLLPDSDASRTAINAQVRALAGWITGATGEP
jgi:acetyl esterase